jgi:hypothetical protein
VEFDEGGPDVKIKGQVLTLGMGKHVVLTRTRMVRVFDDGTPVDCWVSKAFVLRVLNNPWEAFFTEEGFRCAMSPLKTIMYIGCFIFKGSILAQVKKWAGFKEAR